MKAFIIPFFALVASKSAAHKQCGTQSRSQSASALDQARMERLTTRRKMVGESCNELCDQCVEIPTYFHFLGIKLNDELTVLPHPTSTLNNLIATRDESLATDLTSYEEILAIVDEQMDVFNIRFADTPFRFKLMNRNTTTLSTESEWIDWTFDYSREMSAEIGQGGLDTLNVYLSYSISSQIEGFPDSVVAFAEFPSYQFDKSGDGIFLRYDVLPNGGLTGTDTGLTAVHEVGHWLGLLHVFENALEFENPRADPCDPLNYNDQVDDTPVMSGPTQSTLDESCRAFLEVGSQLPDTCPNLPGKDPIWNYLNYLENEDCLLAKGEFTCGQIERMWHQWLLYREEVEACDPDEFLFELIVNFDKRFHSVENTFSLVNSAGEMTIDSKRDHEDDFVISLQDGIVVDLCIPKDSYVFTYNDSSGNGLASGDIELYINRVSRCKIEGNFGRQARVEFDDSEVDCPSVDTMGDIATTSGAPTGEEASAAIGYFLTARTMVALAFAVSHHLIRWH